MVDNNWTHQEVVAIREIPQNRRGDPTRFEHFKDKFIL